MKVNKWTLALAAAGLVSLPTLVQAEEKLSPVLTAVSSTTISGYVDTSAHWDLGTGNANPPPFIYNQGKQDGFNLNKVKVRLDKPLDEAQWAAGYRVDLLFGPDANIFASSSSPFGVPVSDFAIQQAYVNLRAPVANGLDFKMGVFDSIIGYESHDSVNDPNYTRSYGTTIEPHTHTGLLATYQVSDLIGVAVGIADTVGPRINERAFADNGAPGGSSGIIFGPLAGFWAPVLAASGLVPEAGSNTKAESYKTYMGSVAVTAPESMGFLKGSTVYAGVVNGFGSSFLGSGAGLDQTSLYLGTTVNTPITNLKVGAALDLLVADDEFTTTFGNTVKTDMDVWAIALYSSFQATEKLSFHARGEYLDAKLGLEENTGFSITPHPKVFALTGTVQYDLWKNVLSRVEIRWDHSANGRDLFGGKSFGAAPDLKNAVLIAANLIYKF